MDQYLLGRVAYGTASLPATPVPTTAPTPTDSTEFDGFVERPVAPATPALLTIPAQTPPAAASTESAADAVEVDDAEAGFETAPPPAPPPANDAAAAPPPEGEAPPPKTTP